MDREGGGPMNWDIVETVAFLVIVASMLTSFYLYGRANGVLAERKRVESLCHQAVLKRCAGSVRWVWNAISSGQNELISEEAFFGQDKEGP